MSPTPLTTALPKLAAQIDAERPLISAALLDLRVTQIDDTVIHTDVITQHSYDILTSASQQDYLDGVLSRHFGRPTTFSFSLNLPTAEPPLSPVPTPASPRTNNTLTFTERAALQHWMSVTENHVFVARESDTAAARKATHDFRAMVKALPGAESDCEPAFPDITITAGNIASMRKILGIEKLKPQPAVALAKAGDIDLVALHAKVAQHDLQLDPIAGISLAEVLTALRDTLHALKERVDDIDTDRIGTLRQRIEALESANN